MCLEHGVSMGKNTQVSSSVIGRNTKIGADCTVLNSTIGSGCTIGKNVRIIDSFIWDNVIIADNVTVERAILANSVSVGQDSYVPPGSLLSFGVSIGASFSIPAAPPPAISLVSFDGAPLETDTSLVGAAGKGGSYQEPTRRDRKSRTTRSEILRFSRDP